MTAVMIFDFIFSLLNFKLGDYKGNSFKQNDQPVAA